MEQEDREWVKDLFNEVREDQQILAKAILHIANAKEIKPQDLPAELFDAYLIAQR